MKTERVDCRWYSVDYIRYKVSEMLGN